MRGVVVAEELGVAAVLVAEDASRAIHADIILVEDSTVLGLELVALDDVSNELAALLVAVREVAVLAVLAHAALRPLLAQLRLVLPFSEFFGLVGRVEACVSLINAADIGHALMLHLGRSEILSQLTRLQREWLAGAELPSLLGVEGIWCVRFLFVLVSYPRPLVALAGPWSSVAVPL